MVRRQRDACAVLGSDLYAGLLDRVAADVEAAGPCWRVLEPFAGWSLDSAYVLRVMGAVNRLVLTDAAPRLAPHFGPGGDAARAWPELIALLEESGDEVVRLALANPVQTNEVGRCAALAPAILWCSGGRALRVLEIGASGGLNLRWDAYRYDDRWGDPESPVRLAGRYEGEPPPFEPERVEIAERRGCDELPVDDPLTLLSFVWPDQEERVSLLRSALDLAPMIPAPVDASGAADWLERVLAEPGAAGVATVVYHSVVWQYIEEAERARIRSAFAEAGARATGDAPLAWLRMEAAGPETRVDVTTWPGGGSRLLARAGYHGRPVRWLA